MKKRENSFEKLLKIMSRLRGRGGCPWDRKQTHRTILPYILEESYEVIEAVKKGSDEELKEELGDLLLQVVFHGEIARSRGRFDIYDVIKVLNNKLITRHPHVFCGKKGLKTGVRVRNFWEAEKKKTKKRASVLEGVPKAMPALLRSRRLQSKAQATGFKFSGYDSIMKKYREEFGEFSDAVKKKARREMYEELGDLLFVTVTLAYSLKINPEDALQSANDKFIRRFMKTEKHLKPGMSEKEMLALWAGTKNKGHK